MSDSPSNRLLARTWMLSKHRYNPRELGNIMKVKETPPHALSHANTLTSKEQDELAKREREAQTKFDKLDARDREILRLHLVRTESREITMPYPASKRDEMERAGWLYVKQANKGRVLMVKSFVGQLTYAQIASAVGVSERTVQRRLSAMDPAMVRFAELRGWV